MGYIKAGIISKIEGKSLFFFDSPYTPSYVSFHWGTIFRQKWFRQNENFWVIGFV